MTNHQRLAVITALVGLVLTFVGAWIIHPAFALVTLGGVVLAVGLTGVKEEFDL